MTKKKHPDPPPQPTAGDPAAPRPSHDVAFSTGRSRTVPPSSPPASFETAVLWVGPSEPPEHLFRRLLGAYLAGAPEFEVREQPIISAGTREVVRTFTRRTRQPEVVSEEGGTIHLHDLAFESPVSLDQRVERMGRLVLEFHREAVAGWSGLPLGDDTHWERRDDEFDREAWYIQRIATLRLGVEGTAPGLLGCWTIARSLERIADHAVVLGSTGQRLALLPYGQSPATPLRQFHAQAMDHLEGALGVVDGYHANELLDTGHALAASGQALADRLLPGAGSGGMPPATAGAVARVLESIGRTIAYAQDIVQVALDRSIPIVTVDPPPRPSTAPPRRDGFLPAPIP